MSEPCIEVINNVQESCDLFLDALKSGKFCILKDGPSKFSGKVFKFSDAEFKKQPLLFINDDLEKRNKDKAVRFYGSYIEKIVGSKQSNWKSEGIKARLDIEFKKQEQK